MPEDALPGGVVDEAVRLTRLARRAPETTPDDPYGGETSLSAADQYRNERASLLREHGFCARVREEETELTLVCYPTEWVENGEVDMAAIEDTDRAVERRMEGIGSTGAWEPVADHNSTLADAVARRHGQPHGQTARSFARFMSSHRVRRIETATAGDLLEFVDDFFPRNTWPSDAQRAMVMRSLRFTIAAAIDGEASPGSSDE